MGNKIENTLLCPYQLRHFGIDVDDVPMHLAPKTKPSRHSIICSEENFDMSLSLRAVISYFHSRTPTQHKIKTCRWVTITDQSIWDPHSEDLNSQDMFAI
jgi:hypothetical protein